MNPYNHTFPLPYLLVLGLHFLEAHVSVHLVNFSLFSFQLFYQKKIDFSSSFDCKEAQHMKEQAQLEISAISNHL